MGLFLKFAHDISQHLNQRLNTFIVMDAYRQIV